MLLPNAATRLGRSGAAMAAHDSEEKPSSCAVRPLILLCVNSGRCDTDWRYSAPVEVAPAL